MKVKVHTKHKIILLLNIDVSGRYCKVGTLHCDGISQGEQILFTRGKFKYLKSWLRNDSRCICRLKILSFIITWYFRFPSCYQACYAAHVNARWHDKWVTGCKMTHVLGGIRLSSRVWCNTPVFSQHFTRGFKLNGSFKLSSSKANLKYALCPHGRSVIL
jgi:hypothetical protein